MSNSQISPTNLTKIVNSNKNPCKVFKVIVLGDSSVGKTSLTYKFCEGKCLVAPETTIGVDFRERKITIDGEDIKLQLWDTAGQERFRKSMVQHYYRNLHAVIFVYDVSNMATFDSLKQWIEEVDRNCFTDVPRILVGNKCDKEPAVNTNAAQKFADEFNMPLFETSATFNSECDNVDAIFITLAHKLKSQKPMIPKPMAISVSSYTNSSDSQSSCC